MAISNQHRHGIVDRFVKFASWLQKKPPSENVRSSSIIRTFSYESPKRFLDAADKARLQAGYEVLPYFQQLSIKSSSDLKSSLSSSIHHSNERRHQLHHQMKARRSQSSCACTDDKAVSKKVRFQLDPIIHSHQKSDQPQHHRHHHHKKGVSVSTTTFTKNHV
ncbi:unnamed protein product [Rotaria socialis]|uniref:Uncharacterized protein n=1 Tax=Rotaria socialis TaxID=392032 RepID=A0A820YE24_9BILA|nr:unnamed protein product [Rotaria socialis]CAF3401697.1 unnamed protein product [Rotaria socialis]CAF3478881.1 unnamed protein product [Rotaria socialis]CAF4414256.1 unnamed protein product [Rotaria socialis]CAF4545091.1 unnamed protein product [Rotaria socialis]